MQELTPQTLIPPTALPAEQIWQQLTAAQQQLLIQVLTKLCQNLLNQKTKVEG